MMRFLAVIFLICMTQPSIADVFQVQGDTLLYNGEALNGYDAIRAGHEEQLLKILQTHKNIKLLKLTIDGGTKRIAMEMANIIIDAQLDTNGDKKCSSSCVRLLLAGTKRTANLGAQIGFHRGYWLAEGMEIYYEKHKEKYGWSTAFEFSSWLYDDTQKSLYEFAQYLSERGVADYIVGKSYLLSADEMWYMRRKELLSSGILT
jgi:hypothetical protein